MPTTEHTLQAQNQLAQSYPIIINYAVYSAEEEDALLKELHWRCHTSMPIIKILSYTYEDSQDEHAASCRVYKAEVEEIATHIKEINSLGLNEALCLFTEYLLGMQVLCYRYNTEIKCSQVYFGINKKGEPKLCQYPNEENFNAEYSNQYDIQKENVIERVVNGLLEIVYECFDPTKKKEIEIFEEIAERICGEIVSNFAQVHILVRDLAKVFGAKIPLRIGSLCKSLGSQVSGKSLKNIPEERRFLHEELITQQTAFLSHEKPHLQQKSLFYQPIQTHPQPTYSNFFAYSPTKESMATTNFSNFIRCKEELNDVRYLSKPQAHEIINNGKRIVDSMMVENNMANVNDLKNYNNNMNGVIVDNRYNFGGLIPVNNLMESVIRSAHYSNAQSLIGSNQLNAGMLQIQINLPPQHPFQHQMLTNPYSVPSSNIAPYQQINGYSSHPFNYQSSYNALMPTNNFMENGDLKESVWCGEEKKASFLYVKLDKLNGFGREIKTSCAQIE